MSDPIQRTAKIVNTKGLHARAAAKFCKTAEQFNAEVLVSRGDIEVSSCSIMGLLMLAAAQGTEITLSATGEDAEKAMNTICQLVDAGFHED
ncbi:MAG: HPr family phosphocarrier protein [Rhodospirillaceae bacterium]|jgi:phosphocarrier protein|nr:HPr family phosphocarrier protein [Rhodospirillaceae bacterium]MBT5242008.1 HPr family phosphocarrier protein [Rhodospirillaceae bacterium]MBT5565733.1 HPr family phosphocarrier protein [Rhodospirillaceae bacterium]MBT6088540.1 HPr family phosphocarrier protein [Rhodospirillaceae bacterium]MBT6960385.1 HPr family phosphocarrier protein [Rhodospirillaceae bacterium]